MKIRVISSIHGILKIDISDLAKEGMKRKQEDMKPPPLWTPESVDDSEIKIAPPPGHDPEGRNRR